MGDGPRKKRKYGGYIQIHIVEVDWILGIDERTVLLHIQQMTLDASHMSKSPQQTINDAVGHIPHEQITAANH